MKKETNVKLKVVTHDHEDNEIKPYCRVKLDTKGFPYIIVHDEKFIISQTTFPQKLTVWGEHWATAVECIEGQEELNEILGNKSLTVDKLSIKQTTRVSA